MKNSIHRPSPAKAGRDSRPQYHLPELPQRNSLRIPQGRRGTAGRYLRQAQRGFLLSGLQRGIRSLSLCTWLRSEKGRQSIPSQPHFLRVSQKHFAGLVKPGIIQVMQKNLWRVASKFLPYLHILSHGPEISGLPLLSEIAA